MKSRKDFFTESKLHLLNNKTNLPLCDYDEVQPCDGLNVWEYTVYTVLLIASFCHLCQLTITTIVFRSAHFGTVGSYIGPWFKPVSQYLSIYL